MADEKRLDADGMLTTIRGLGAKSEALSTAQSAAETLAATRQQHANDVLATAYGPWAAEFRAKEHELLAKLASRWFYLGYASSACAAWPSPSLYGGSPTSIGDAIASKSALNEPAGTGPDRAGVNTTKLAAYIELAQSQHDQVLAHQLDDVDLDGVSGEQRPILHNPDGSDTGLYTELTTPLSAGDLAGHMPFLNRDDDNVMGLSSEVLTFANDHLEAFSRESEDPPGPGGGTDLDRPNGGQDQPPPTSPPPTPEETPEIPIDEALPLLAANIDRLDGTPPDGKLTLDELKAAARDESLPPDLRAVAALLAANEALFAEIAALNGRDQKPPAITADDVATFVAALPALETVLSKYGAFDADGDGAVTTDELKAVLLDGTSGPAARQAASFLLDQPAALERLASFGEPPAVSFRESGDPTFVPEPPPDTTSFTQENLTEMVNDYRELLGQPPLPPPPMPMPPPGQPQQAHDFEWQAAAL